MYKNIYIHFLRAYHNITACVFCGTVKEGIVCNSCSTYFCCRQPPFCTMCGVRLVSEDTYCGACRLLCNDIHGTCTVPRFIHSCWAYNEYTKFLSKEFKKNGNRLLGYYIALKFKKYLELLRLFNTRTCIIPLPANAAHVKDVGFDHMKLLCSYLRHMGEIDVYCCIARHESREQKTLGKTEREKNMKQSLYLRNTHIAFSFMRNKDDKAHLAISSALLKYDNIVLLDDITTTGASFFASVSLLTPLHQSIASKLRLVSLTRNEY